MNITKTTDHIISLSSQEPPASSKSPNQDFKDMDVLCNFKIKILRQNFEYVCIKNQWPYPNKYPTAKPQS